MSESQKIEQGRRAIVQAKYLPLLGAFRADDDDVRYYLRGIYIEPHESGVGAYLVATDGHRLVVVHDEEAVIDRAMLVDPSKLIFREAKGAKLADFDGSCCDLQDEDEAFILRAPARLVDAKYIDWRAVVPTDDVVPEPGSIDPGLLSAISKAPFGDKTKNASIYVRRDRPCVIRFPSLPEIFVLVMPQNYPAMRSKPEWIGKARKVRAEEQTAFDLTSAGAPEDDDTPPTDHGAGGAEAS